MGRNYRLMSTAAVCAVAVGASFGAPAMAQSDNQVALDEVVVTAQRRDQNLQDVPIAVSAVTAAVAQKLGINDATTVSQIVPGFTLPNSGNSSTPFIRGVGTTGSSVGNEPSVAMFIDDVYIPTGIASAFDFNNIDSIEVLKGPQGTLFGRNATGGVVHIHTRNPTSTPTADATVSYGNYDTIQGQLYASGGLAEGIAANIAGYWVDQSKGWGRNFVQNRKVYDREGRGVRAKVLFDDVMSSTLLLNASYDRRHSAQGFGLSVVPGTFGRSGYSPAARGGDFYDTFNDYGDGYVTEHYQISAKLRHDFEAASLVSITAYGDLDSVSQLDVDASPDPFFNSPNHAQGKTFSQEFQLLAPPSSDIQWILGAFFLKDQSTFSGGRNGTAVGPALQSTFARQSTNSYSGFAQAGAEILPRTRLTIGVRYTSDQRKFLGAATSGAINYGPVTGQKTFSNLTGRFSLDYKFTDDVLGYVAYNRGFKSGIYNLLGVAPGITAPPPPVLPEDLNAYTAGFKSEFLDGRARLNAEAYYYDYKNIQVQQVVAGLAILSNGGAATIKGIDVDFTFRATERLTITASAALADGHYDKFLGGPQSFPLPPNTPIPIPAGCAGVVTAYPTPTPGAPIAQRFCDLSGNKTVMTVPLATNLAAIYEIPTAIGPVSMAVSWAHGGNYYFDPDNNPKAKQPKTDLINASVRWTAASESFFVEGWAKNISKQKYYSYLAQSTVAGTKYSPAPPRTYGVTLGAHF